jgi:hypothetical protein
LFEIKAAKQRDSLWYFHVYMHYNLNWFISLNFLHYIIVPFFLMVVSVSLRFLYSLFTYFYFLLLYWMGVHCGIYKSSYNVSNISYLNLYSFLYREYVNHIQLLSFLLLPCLSIHDLSLVWPVFHDIAAFVLGLYSTYDGEHAALDLLSIANIKMMFSSFSIYLRMTKFHFFCDWVEFHCISLPHFLNPFIRSGASHLFP